MGEDSIKVLQDYRTRLVGIRLSVGSELSMLKGAIKWGRSLGLALVPFDGSYTPPEEKIHPM
jgi:hypothetical protein